MKFRKSLLTLSLMAAAQAASASGFALIEQSASGQGLSYAGAAANTEDSSVMWFNPAGMTEIKGHELIAAAHVIIPSAKFHDQGSNVLGSPLYGKEENGARTGLVPNLYWKGQYKGVDLGLGINVPFGSTVDYDQDWIGRYHAVYTETKTVNINPSFAKKVSEKLSVGAGVSAQYVSVRMTQKIDFGLASTPQSNDGYADLEASGWGFGYNFGLMYETDGKARLGLSYRSKVSQSPTGTADFTTPSNITDAAYKDTDINASIDLPASASLSLLYPISDKTNLLADATWTGWSSFKELRIEFDNPAKPDTVQPENWKDVMRYSLGFTHQYDSQLTLRTGMAYDQTPIKNQTYRTPRIVDSNREWLSVGFGYQFAPQWKLDVGYSHLWGGKPKIDAKDADTKAHILKGYFDVKVDILSAQLVWKY
jgi:long-chain fatty acid transport protein